MKILLNNNVSKILNILNNNGYEAYIVGGCVRDSLLNIKPKDWDITTNALPDEILECFKEYRCFEVGKKFGTISVVMDKECFEITTFRFDGEYTDNRHPDNVEFSRNLKDDLQRRDFTVNAMAYNEEDGLIDFFNGQRDLKYKALRCVGDPSKRFNEDALRILRALRFSSVYGFTIEINTSNAIFKNKGLLNNISNSRIISELNLLLCGEYCDFILRRYKDIFAVIIPEITTMFNFDQNNPHHNKTLWKHTVASVKLVQGDALLKTAMLFHDIGKPLTKSTDENNISHFHGHPKLSAAVTNNILKRLGYPNDFIKQVVTLIEYHDYRLTADKKIIKRLLSKIGEQDLRLLLKIQRADILAQSMYKREEKLSTLDMVCVLFEEIIKENECFSLKQLEISGRDLIHIGITNGIQIGDTLDELLKMVIRENIPNEKSVLISKAKELNKI